MAVGATEYKDYINGVATYAPCNFGGGSVVMVVVLCNNFILVNVGI